MVGEQALILLAVCICVVATGCSKKEAEKTHETPTCSTELLIDKGVLGEWSVGLILCEPRVPGGMLPFYGYEWAMTISNGEVSFSEDKEAYQVPEGVVHQKDEELLYKMDDVLENNEMLMEVGTLSWVSHMQQAGSYVWAFSSARNEAYKDKNKNYYDGDIGLLFAYDMENKEIVYALAIYVDNYCYSPISDCFLLTVDGVTYPCHDVTQE